MWICFCAVTHIWNTKIDKGLFISMRIRNFEGWGNKERNEKDVTRPLKWKKKKTQKAINAQLPTNTTG